MQVNQKAVMMFFCLFLVGCSTTDKLPKVKGDWQLINQTDFIPQNAKKYIEGIDVQVVEETENTENK